ncbi:guanine nucleotide binding protein, alpha subunit [Meredithblackwellia eburnea MCA 4105]
MPRQPDNPHRPCVVKAVIEGYRELSIEIPTYLSSDAFLIETFSGDIIDARTGGLRPDLTKAIANLWKDSTTKDVVGQSWKYQLNDSARYFFESLPRIGSQDYVCTDQDILHTRIRTTGITEEKFQIKDNTLRVLDVGGQRSERKKWIHCFEGVNVLLYVVAISEVGQTLWEDRTASRLDEALMLLESVSSSRWFMRSSFILFLNKVDLFRERLANVSLATFYPEYTRGEDFESCCDFMLKKFQSVDRRGDSRELFTHFTHATDTTSIKVVLSAIAETIINRSLAEVGIL